MIMKVYREIILRPQPDIALNFLWEKVFQQIHIGLVEMKDKDDKVPIGISLPEYMAEGSPLGSKLRLFALSIETLEKLNVNARLSRLTDYVHLTGIRDVPGNIKTFSCFKRQQLKTNIERLARRKAKRQNINIEQAIEELDGFKDELVKTPFINMQSLSSSKRFRLFIQKKVSGVSKNEGFSTYGLSHVSTVPEF